MAEPAPLLISPEEYVNQERTRDYRSEYVNGEVYAMAGGSMSRARIARNLLTALDRSLSNGPCEVIGGDLRVKSVETVMYTYPDAAIMCEDAAFEDDQADTLLEPLAIFEVLSPSTMAYDRGAKWAHYQTIPSLRHYVLVSQNEMRIEHYVRLRERTWEMTTYTRPNEEIPFDPPGITLRVGDVYRRVDVEPGDIPKGTPRNGS